MMMTVQVDIRYLLHITGRAYRPSLPLPPDPTFWFCLFLNVRLNSLLQLITPAFQWQCPT